MSETITTYRNGFYHFDKQSRDREPFLTAHVRPTEYRGLLIFHRAGGWDVVQDGVCIAMMAGFNGAKAEIDAILDGSDHPMHEWRLKVLARVAEAKARNWE